jgi:hypothetical protein
MKKNLQIICLILTISTIFSLGCGMIKSNAVTEKSDPKETYINALKKLKEVKFFTAVIDFGDAKNITYNYVAPDKLKTTITLAKSMSVYHIGSDNYKESVTEPGSFTKSTAPGSERLENWQFPSKDVMSNLDKIKEVKFDRKDTLNGKEVFIYQESESGSVLMVSPETGLPARIASIDDNGDPKVIEYSYDKEPKIEAPTNVK